MVLRERFDNFRKVVKSAVWFLRFGVRFDNFQKVVKSASGFRFDNFQKVVKSGCQIWILSLMVIEKYIFSSGTIVIFTHCCTF